MVSRTGPIPLAPPLKKRAMLLSTRATTSTAIMWAFCLSSTLYSFLESIFGFLSVIPGLRLNLLKSFWAEKNSQDQKSTVLPKIEQYICHAFSIIIVVLFLHFLNRIFLFLHQHYNLQLLLLSKPLSSSIGIHNMLHHIQMFKVILWTSLFIVPIASLLPRSGTRWSVSLQNGIMFLNGSQWENYILSRNTVYASKLHASLPKAQS